MKLLEKRVTRRGLIGCILTGGSGIAVAAIVGCGDENQRSPTSQSGRVRATATSTPTTSATPRSTSPSITSSPAPTVVETATSTQQSYTAAQTQVPETVQSTPAPVSPVYVEIAGQNFIVENGGGLTGEQLLNLLVQNGYLSFLGDHYPPPLGSVFVKEINGMSNSWGKYWVFEIDQQRVDLGASLVTVPSGSKMSWALLTPL